MKNTWQLQDAKNRFSEVVEKALTSGHQTITKRGHPAVVVLSLQEYRRLQKPKNKLSDFFAESPLHGIQLRLERRQDTLRDFSL
jgi:prevent-host-death family protein